VKDFIVKTGDRPNSPVIDFMVNTEDGVVVTNFIVSCDNMDCYVNGKVRTIETRGQANAEGFIIALIELGRELERKFEVDFQPTLREKK